jgi:FKBP-type peptidyl-prolyl cis-trans isomerase
VKKKILAVTLTAAMVALMIAGCTKPGEKDAEEKVGKVELKNFADRVSYMIGADIGASLRTNKAEVDPALVSRGLEDSYLERPLLMNEEEIAKVKQEFTEKLQRDYQDNLAEMSARNLAEGEAFLAENAKKEGVVTTASGLQYEVVVQGSGPKPGPKDMVKVHYRGTLLDGKEFDSSYQRGEPVVLNPDSLIPGWSEALQLMPVGSKYKLVLPAALAYGEKEVGPDIGPNATLLFEIELLGIE